MHGPDARGSDLDAVTVITVQQNPAFILRFATSADLAVLRSLRYRRGKEQWT